MNIRDLQNNPSRTERLRSGSVGQASRAEAAYGSQSKAGTTASSASDSVEISEAGRAAAGNMQAGNIEFARKALLGIPPLSEERAADILKRVQEGFYSQPEVLKQIAQKVIDNLRTTGDI